MSKPAVVSTSSLTAYNGPSQYSRCGHYWSIGGRLKIEWSMSFYWSFGNMDVFLVFTPKSVVEFIKILI